MIGTIEVKHDPPESRLTASVDLPDYELLMQVAERLRRLFDLGADPLQIAGALTRDQVPSLPIECHSGIRVPGTWEGFELATKAIMGEHLFSRRLGTRLRKLVATFGQPIQTSIAGLTHLFPTPPILVAADLSSIGVPPTQATAIKILARLVIKSRITFEAPTSLEDTLMRIRLIPGISERSANYIAMRAFGEPDAFPFASRALTRIAHRRSPDIADIPRLCEKWRPWRAYAAMEIWAQSTALADRHSGNAPTSSLPTVAMRAGPNTARL